MANVQYPLGRSAVLRGEVDWESDTFKVALLDNGYTWNAAHEFLTDLAGAVLAEATLTGCTVLPDGIADADDSSVSGLNAPDVATSVVIYKDTGVPGTSRLIAYLNENDDTTLINRVGDGTPVAIAWSASATRVFRI
jgi:hypothetical protein